MGQNVIDLLLKTQLIDDRQHDSAMSRSRSSAGGHVIQTIAEMGYATESTIARALSVELGLPRIELAQTPPEQEALVLLDARTCLDRFVLPIALRENGELLWLAMADPTDSDTISLVKRKAQKRVRPVVAGPTEILRAAARLYSSVIPQGLYQPESVDQDKLDEVEMSAIELKEEGEVPESFEVVNVMDDSATPLTRLAEQLGVEVPETIVRRARAPAGEEIDLGDDAMTELEPELTPLPAVAPPPARTAIGAQQRAAPASAQPPAHHGAGLQVRAHTGVQPRVAPGRPQPPPPTGQQQRAGPAPQTQQQARVPAPRASQHPAAAPHDEDPLRIPEPSRGRAVDDLQAEDVLTLEAIRSSMEKAALVIRAVAELCVEKGVFTREEMVRKRQQ